MLSYRATTVADIAQLPAVERSAGAAFRAIPELAWIADDAVLSVSEHRRLLDAQWCWVACKADALCGFVSAEPFDDALHVCELAAP